MRLRVGSGELLPRVISRGTHLRLRAKINDVAWRMGWRRQRISRNRHIADSNLDQAVGRSHVHHRSDVGKSHPKRAALHAPTFWHVNRESPLVWVLEANPSNCWKRFLR